MRTLHLSVSLVGGDHIPDTASAEMPHLHLKVCLIQP